MNKEIVVEEIGKTLSSNARFRSLGRVLEVSEAIYDKLEVIGALKPKSGIEKLREAATELQNKRLSNG